MAQSIGEIAHDVAEVSRKHVPGKQHAPALRMPRPGANEPAAQAGPYPQVLVPGALGPSQVTWPADSLPGPHYVNITLTVT